MPCSLPAGVLYPSFVLATISGIKPEVSWHSGMSIGGASAEFELEVLRVHLREVPFLKQTLEQHRSNIYKYMEQLTLLSKMVQSDAAGETRLGWGGDMYYRILRNHYPDEWCWLLHAYAHPDAEEREAELMLRRGKH